MRKFRQLFPYRNRNGIHKLKYNLAEYIFNKGDYDRSLNLLLSHLLYVTGNKRTYFSQTIRLIKNNEGGVRN
jgi:hypothetical protein